MDRLASAAPAPGGGSAAAFTAAEAAGLAAMVARLTLGKKKYITVEAQMTDVRDEAETLRKELTNAVVEDAAAFDNLMAAMKLPKNTPEDETKRNQAIEKATLKAAQVPLAVAQKALRVIELIKIDAELGNSNAISDAGSGATLARAAMTCAGMNVRINLKDIQNLPESVSLLAEMTQTEIKADALLKGIYTSIEERGGFKAF